MCVSRQKFFPFKKEGRLGNIVLLTNITMESFSPYAVQPFSPLTTNFVRVLSKSEMTYEIFNHCISNILHSVNFVKDMAMIKFQNKKFKLLNG